jgi:hypothetical protein
MKFDFSKVTFQVFLMMLFTSLATMALDPDVMALLTEPWRSAIPKAVKTALIAGGCLLIPSPLSKKNGNDEAPPPEVKEEKKP